MVQVVQNGIETNHIGVVPISHKCMKERPYY